MANKNQSHDIRWKQRFQNFKRAFNLLREPFEKGAENLSVLEKEGVAQRFEYTIELAWKTLKDFLEESGLVIAPVTPKNVIKEAYAANLISDGQVWIDMLEIRNLLSHTYDEKVFSDAVNAIDETFLEAIEALVVFLVGRENSP
ncbi:MAG: nucleotidyltransferase substrate binding protein [Planctomycetes bacterium]|nr:nucleotidyltransferase substrate binding protein [Planctomycetota bacterium]